MQGSKIQIISLKKILPNDLITNAQNLCSTAQYKKYFRLFLKFYDYYEIHKNTDIRKSLVFTTH